MPIAGCVGREAHQKRIDAFSALSVSLSIKTVSQASRQRQKEGANSMTDRQWIDMASDLRTIALAIEAHGACVALPIEHRFISDATRRVERVRNMADKLGVRMDVKRKGYSVWARVSESVKTVAGGGA